MKDKISIKIYTDGASRGNPGPSSYGYVILNSDNEVIKEEGKVIGNTTNNVAEYTAVLSALTFVRDGLSKKKQVEKIELFADSKLVVEQLSGRFKIKAAHLFVILQKIRVIVAGLGPVQYKHIPRELNSAADSLANQALDGLL